MSVGNVQNSQYSIVDVLSNLDLKKKNLLYVDFHGRVQIWNVKDSKITKFFLGVTGRFDKIKVAGAIQSNISDVFIENEGIYSKLESLRGKFEIGEKEEAEGCFSFLRKEDKTASTIISVCRDNFSPKHTLRSLRVKLDEWSREKFIPVCFVDELERKLGDYLSHGKKSNLFSNQIEAEWDRSLREYFQNEFRSKISELQESKSAPKFLSGLTEDQLFRLIKGQSTLDQVVKEWRDLAIKARSFQEQFQEKMRPLEQPVKKYGSKSTKALSENLTEVQLSNLLKGEATLDKIVAKVDFECKLNQFVFEIKEFNLECGGGLDLNEVWKVRDELIRLIEEILEDPDQMERFSEVVCDRNLALLNVLFYRHQPFIESELKSHNRSAGPEDCFAIFREVIKYIAIKRGLNPDLVIKGELLLDGCSVDEMNRHLKFEIERRAGNPSAAS